MELAAVDADDVDGAVALFDSGVDGDDAVEDGGGLS